MPNLYGEIVSDLAQDLLEVLASLLLGTLGVMSLSLKLCTAQVRVKLIRLPCYSAL
jgi:hypothetical protein